MVALAPAPMPIICSGMAAAVCSFALITGTMTKLMVSPVPVTPAIPGSTMPISKAVLPIALIARLTQHQPSLTQMELVTAEIPINSSSITKVLNV